MCKDIKTKKRNAVLELDNLKTIARAEGRDGVEKRVTKETTDFVEFVETPKDNGISYQPKTGHQAILEQLKRDGVKPTLYMSTI